MIHSLLVTFSFVALYTQMINDNKGLVELESKCIQLFLLGSNYKIVYFTNLRLPLHLA